MVYFCVATCLFDSVIIRLLTQEWLIGFWTITYGMYYYTHDGLNKTERNEAGIYQVCINHDEDYDIGKSIRERATKNIRKRRERDRITYSQYDGERYVQHEAVLL